MIINGAKNLTGLVAAINPVQSGTGDASPTNVRPISGWTGVEVRRCGKNLFDKSAITANSWIVVDSTTIEDHAGYFVSDYIPIKKRVKIICTTRNATRCAYYDVQKNPIAYVSWGQGVFNPQYDGFIRVTDSNGNLDTLQIELGDTATTYESYNGNKYSVSIPATPGTVYGGTLDVVKGILAVTHVYKELAVADMNNNDNYPGWKNQPWVADLAQGASISSAPNGSYCNINTDTTHYSTYFSVNRNDGILFLPKGKYTLTQTEWIATYPNLIVQIVAPLATPVTYQLTPQQIAALAGYNTVWADSGDVSVTYKA